MNMYKAWRKSKRIILLLTVGEMSIARTFFQIYQSPSYGITRTHFFLLPRGPAYREFSVYSLDHELQE
jgi:hypothetical protein